MVSALLLVRSGICTRIIFPGHLPGRWVSFGGAGAELEAVEDLCAVPVCVADLSDGICHGVLPVREVLPLGGF